MVRITGNPQTVEKNRKFSGHGHDGSFFAIFPASFEHSSAPAFEVTVRTKTSQKILGTLNQQRAELLVPGLADPELLVDRAGLVATRCQAKICRYISGMSDVPEGGTRNPADFKMPRTAFISRVLFLTNRSRAFSWMMSG